MVLFLTTQNNLVLRTSHMTDLSLHMEKSGEYMDIREALNLSAKRLFKDRKPHPSHNENR